MSSPDGRPPGMRDQTGVPSFPSGLPEVTTGAQGDPYRRRSGFLLAGGSPWTPVVMLRTGHTGMRTHQPRLCRAGAPGQCPKPSKHASAKSMKRKRQRVVPECPHPRSAWAKPNHTCQGTESENQPRAELGPLTRVVASGRPSEAEGANAFSSSEGGLPARRGLLISSHRWQSPVLHRTQNGYPRVIALAVPKELGISRSRRCRRARQRWCGRARLCRPSGCSPMRRSC
jgi:hypothetical protein